MERFLFKKDMWLLDFGSVMTFALCMSALVQIGADSGERNSRKILYAMAFGAASYIAAGVLGLFLGRKLLVIRSWIWLGVVGAIIQVIVRRLRIYPGFWSERGEVTAINIASDIIPWLIANWVFWSVPGCLAILTARLLFVSWNNRKRPPELRLP